MGPATACHLILSLNVTSPSRNLDPAFLVHCASIATIKRHLQSQGDWMCSRCVAGLEPLPPAGNARIARDRFFAGHLDLARIEALWREPDDSVWFSGRWYYRPEETHTGRQASRTFTLLSISRSQSQAIFGSHESHAWELIRILSRRCIPLSNLRLPAIHVPLSLFLVHLWTEKIGLGCLQGARISLTEK